MKIVSTIEGRMESNRLPSKTVARILGKPMLELLIERLKRAKRIDEIVVATTTRPEDTIIVELAERMNVRCFRGSSEDVLDRVLRATKAYQGDIIVEMSGDNPLLDPTLVDRMIETYLESKADYVSNTLRHTYPRGLRVQVFSVEILEEVSELTDKPLDREDVSRYIYEHPERYSLLNVEAPLGQRHPEYRWTVDFKEDLELVRRIYEELYRKNPNFLTGDIITLLKQRPELCEINAHINPLERLQCSEQG